jgi:hypothetical protein
MQRKTKFRDLAKALEGRELLSSNGSSFITITLIQSKTGAAVTRHVLQEYWQDKELCSAFKEGWEAEGLIFPEQASLRAKQEFLSEDFGFVLEAIANSIGGHSRERHADAPILDQLNRRHLVRLGSK